VDEDDDTEVELPLASKGRRVRGRPSSNQEMKATDNSGDIVGISSSMLTASIGSAIAEVAMFSTLSESSKNNLVCVISEAS
jgi:hypothetical protein